MQIWEVVHILSYHYYELVSLFAKQDTVNSANINSAQIAMTF